MKKVLNLFLVAGLIFSAQAISAKEARQVDTVVELYTSQGCSSCPPADKLMGWLVNDRSVLGLSFPVTYWDYIGWPDTFASKDNDNRQVRYKQTLNTRYVYTPQMVIGGVEHFVGSNEAELRSHLENFKGHARKIDLKWRFNGNNIEIDLPTSKANMTIWQLDIDHAKDVDIKRGENRGRTVTYHNVVRKIHNLGTWKGDVQTITLDLNTLMNANRDGCALIFQEGVAGPIKGALVIEL